MFTGHNREPQGRRISASLPRKGAFTLLEVTLSMVILALLAGALYAMIDASVRGTSELEVQGDRTQQVSGFLGLCRKTFRSLPASASFQARVIAQGEGHITELIFRNSPGLFAWGNENNLSVSTILGARPHVGGRLDLSILQDSEDEISSYLNGGTASRPWLVLFPDLRAIKWRFFDSRTQTWMNEWKETGVRPVLVELLITLESGSERYVFWLPPIIQSQ